jgi:hypothetical protein
MIVTSSCQNPAQQQPKAQSSLKGRRASLSPEQRERARSRDRIKYAARMQRDPISFRAKRNAIAARFYRTHRRPGVHVELIC